MHSTAENINDSNSNSLESDFAKHKKARAYYPDKLSLIDSDPTALTNYSLRIINQKAIQKLKDFAEINPIQFRRLWLLFQYQDYKIKMDFTTAKSLIKGYVKQKALGSRDPDHITAPNRRQILGVIREQKIRMFIDYYKYIYSESGKVFDIFEFAANAPIDDLLFSPNQINFLEDEPNPFDYSSARSYVNSIYQKKFKLPKLIWSAILSKVVDVELLKNIYITLPRADGNEDAPAVDLGHEFNRYVPEQTNAINYDDLGIEDTNIDDILAWFEN